MPLQLSPRLTKGQIRSWAPGASLMQPWVATAAGLAKLGAGARAGTNRLSRMWAWLPCPLWLALAAIMPATWSPVLVYFGITIILGLIDWTGLARAVRSRLLSLREEDFCVAAQLMGEVEAAARASTRACSTGVRRSGVRKSPGYQLYFEARMRRNWEINASISLISADQGFIHAAGWPWLRAEIRSLVPVASKYIP